MMEVYIETPDGRIRWNMVNTIPRIGELVTTESFYKEIKGRVKDVCYKSWSDGSLSITIYLEEVE